jgi:hypothetical protein
MHPCSVRSISALIAVLALAPALTHPVFACFGTRLRVGVDPASEAALACYAAGYYVEEKTGIEPEFVAVEDVSSETLRRGKIDLYLAREAAPVPEGLTTRPAGAIPGLGPAQFWIRPDVLDDLRFFKVDRALGRLAGFYASPAYQEAHRSQAPPKKAARQAVLRAD